MRIVIVLALLGLLFACDSDAQCPDSLATSSAEWRAPEQASDQCVQLARALNTSGGFELGGDAGDCAGTMDQSVAGGECRATLRSSCDGITFELACTVRGRVADCEARIDAAELEHPCSLRVSLR